MATRNVTVALNLTDSLNVTESKVDANLSKVLHTIQVGGGGYDGIRLSSYEFIKVEGVSNQIRFTHDLTGL